MAEVIGATATFLSIIGFSAQAFDGCVKGFVLLSTAHNLGRDADILRSMLDWELYRLEQWSEQVNLQDPAKADMLVDWDLVSKTLKHLENLLNDANMLKKMYGLELTEEPSEAQTEEDEEKPLKNRFRRLFGSSDKYSSTAAAKVIQAKNTPVRKLWWATVDKENMKRLIADVSHFVQRLHDSLSASVQSEMQQSIRSLLRQAADRYSNVPDLDYLRGLAIQLRQEKAVDELGAEDLEEVIEEKFRYSLFHAIRKGELWEVESLLDRGVNVDAEDHVGWSTLICAANHGQSAVFKLLLERGAHPRHGTVGNRIPLHFAAEGGHVEIVKQLLNQPKADINFRDKEGQTAFFKAAHEGRKEVIKLLLQQNDIDVNAASKDGFTPLLQALFGGCNNIARMLLARPELDVNTADQNYGQTPLWMAASGDKEIFQEILKRQDLDVNRRSRYGETALGRAARQSYNEVIPLLQDAKADVNASDDSDSTPLIHAAGEGNQAGVELLVANPEIQLDLVDKKGRTALFRAAEAGQTKCVKALISKGTQLEIKDKQGKSALSIAAREGHKIPAKMLIKAGADINTQDEKGNTPLALATENNKEILVRLLLENGADAELGDEDEETPLEKAKDQKLEDIVKLFERMTT